MAFLGDKKSGNIHPFTVIVTDIVLNISIVFIICAAVVYFGGVLRKHTLSIFLFIVIILFSVAHLLSESLTKISICSKPTQRFITTSVVVVVQIGNHISKLGYQPIQEMRREERERDGGSTCSC
ncbi:hypothetical protein ACJX0J_021721 [Zea mays]